MTYIRTLIAVASLALACFSAAPAQAEPDNGPANFAINESSASLSSTQAGAHADFTNTFGINYDSDGEVYSRLEDVTVDLPPGLVGNPRLFPTCSIVTFAAYDSFNKPDPCPVATQVGTVAVTLRYPGDLELHTLNEALYNLPAPEGAPARLGFIGLIYPVVIDFKVRSDGDYGITAIAHGAAARISVNRVAVTTWGVPADPSHDELRLGPIEAVYEALGVPEPPKPSPLAPAPFMSNATSCEPSNVHFDLDTYRLPGQHFLADAPLAATTGCQHVPFQPLMNISPTSAAEGAPTGINFDLTMPQDGLSDPDRVRQADLRKAVVTLPAGMTINPAAAQGREACSEAQVGLVSEDPLRFNTDPALCPNAAKVGEVRIDTPLLADPLTGSLFLAAQNDNPFHTLLSGYLVAAGSGVTLKLAGRFDLDPDTGRVTATFDSNPQLPFSQLHLEFYGGPHGPLTNPDCGQHTIDAVFDGWNGASVLRTSSFTIDQNCDAFGQFNPQLNAGVTNAAAGSSSSFTLQLTRPDGEQNITGLTTTLPPGLLAKIAGVPLCPDAGAVTGDCPDESQVGSTTVATGSGPDPLYIPQPGKAPTAVYLSGPYKGGPYSLVIKVPAQAGPFDLGTVAVRAAIFIDPEDAHVTVVSDPLPQIIQGIPLSYRDIRVTVDRPGFMVAPTSCDPMQVAADVSSAGTDPEIAVDASGLGFSQSPGTVAHLASRFQVGGCQDLPFAPKLHIGLGGGKSQTTPGKHPTLTATYSQAPGQANTKAVKVALPLSLALDPNNSQHVCDHDQAAAVHGGDVPCPASTIVGTATAQTPLLPNPLKANVYLVQGLRTTNTGRVVKTLPTLLVPLRGPDGVALDLRAQSSVVQNKLVTTFSSVPDAPVSKFVLAITGGSKGILTVTGSKSLCLQSKLANETATAQSGKQIAPGVTLGTPCPKRSSARLKVRSVHAANGKLTVAGRIARTARNRITVTAACGTAQMSRKVRQHRGAWKATLPLRGSCSKVRVTAIYPGGPDHLKARASRVVRRG